MNIVFASKLNSCRGDFNRLLLLVFSFLLVSNNVLAENLKLAWNPSKSAKVAGYKIFYGNSSRKYTSSKDVGKRTTYTVTGLKAGAKYFFALKAYNSTRTKSSSYSNEVSVIVPAASKLSADFTASKTSGVPRLAVKFTPKTTGTVRSWKWRFEGSLTPSVTNQTPKITTATYTKPGIYTVSLTVTGSKGSAAKTKSNLITVKAPTPPAGKIPPAVITPSPATRIGNKGLVAAYGFEEISGTIVADASGKSNHGTIKEAVRISAGRYGKALKFDGVNDWVTVSNSASLALSTGMTIEAWVYPSVSMNGWKTVLMKEQSGQQAYTLCANSDSDQPAMIPWIGGERIVKGGSQLTPKKWWHLAATYDGKQQRLYVNGKQVAVKSQSGAILTSAGALHIGGNSIWGEYFRGYIDEVRIYNRALSAAELAKDKSTAISVSNPPQLVAGNKVLEPNVDYAAQGIAKAFKVTSRKKAIATAIQVYLDASSKAPELAAGIYSDSKGHPSALLAQGKINIRKAGATNTVRIPAVALAAGKPYWIAILGSKGQIRFRDRKGSTAAPMETSASKSLKNLPSRWSTGSVSPNDGPMSVYGAGY